MSKARPAAGAVLAWRQTKPGTKLAAIAEDLRIGNRGGQSTGGHRADAEQFAGASCDVTASGVISNLLVTAGKPQVHRRQLFTHLQQHGAHRVRQSGVFDKCGQCAEKPVGRARDHHPNSASNPRVRFSSAVRCSCQPERMLCHARIACCSTDLMATKRMVGCRAATAIASASAASFLPPSLNGLTNSAGIAGRCDHAQQTSGSSDGTTHRLPSQRGTAITVRPIARRHRVAARVARPPRP
ncbi:hypothetical protein OKW28_005215 [Paraburkholderia sp. 40]